MAGTDADGTEASRPTPAVTSRGAAAGREGGEPEADGARVAAEGAATTAAVADVGVPADGPEGTCVRRSSCCSPSSRVTATS